MAKVALATTHKRTASETAGGGLATAAYERLKQGVVEGELAPGAFISQNQIEQRYKLSRAAIRGALARLEQEGLVESIPRRGYRIAPFTIRDIEEIFAVRGLIEPIATRLAACCLNSEALAELHSLNNVSFVPSDGTSERLYVQANRRFHLLIAQASQNRRLVALIQQIHDESMRLSFLTMSFRDDTQDWRLCHSKIIDALAKGDGEAAENYSRAEIATGREAALRALLRNPAISSTNLMPAQYGT
jgi:DNA-binding GntR family transcriptional regulator